MFPFDDVIYVSTFPHSSPIESNNISYVSHLMGHIPYISQPPIDLLVPRLEFKPEWSSTGFPEAGN